MPRLISVNAEADATSIDRSVLEAIRTAMSGIRFGCVEIVIHDSKVVLINRTEKLKLPPDGAT